MRKVNSPILESSLYWDPIYLRWYRGKRENIHIQGTCQYELKEHTTLNFLCKTASWKQGPEIQRVCNFNLLVSHLRWKKCIRQPSFTIVVLANLILRSRLLTGADWYFCKVPKQVFSQSAPGTSCQMDLLPCQS